MPDQSPVIVVTAGGAHAWILVNALADAYSDVRVIEEAPEPKSAFLKRRARLIGWPRTAGQFATMVLSRFGKRFAARRTAEILAARGVSAEPDAHVPVTRVASVNAPECLEAILAAKPGVVLLVSCRLMRAPVIAAIPCPVLNCHPGITPAYRGMWGGYWARALADPGNYGSTVHLVDAGVDTGDVVRQVRHAPHPRETIFTDALAQAAAAREIVVASVGDALANRLAPVPAAGASRQHFHPTLWFYLWRGLTGRVW